MTANGESMMAVSMDRIGKPRVLKYGPCPMPIPAGDEVLVKIHATSANPNDLLFRAGRLIIRKPLPHILGADLAGEIAQVGHDVSNWEVGDRVAASFEGLGCEREGSYAEYCAVPADQLVKMPDSLDFQVAMAAGASFANAWTALVSNGKIKKADRVVIQGAASPLGIAAVQIARAKGSLVIAISRSESAAQLREVGADIVLDDAGSDLVRQVKVATDERGATLVLHSADNEALVQSIDMLDYKGRLVLAAPTRRRDARLNLVDVYLKNLSILGSYDSLKTKDFGSILQDFSKGKYQSAIDVVMPLSQARKAHEKMEKNLGFGKIVLVPDAVLEAAKKPANWIPID